MPPSNLPKINPPLIAHLLRRTRLLSDFDACWFTPLTWVCGAPGQGKTSAVVDYVAARKLRTAWLNIDEEDGDPASFFHYLSLAFSVALPRYRFRFPLFESEYQKNIQGFARLFFRYAATRISTTLCLVLDNAHTVRNEVFYQLLDIAAQELSAHIKLIVISREAPPMRLVRLYANQQLGVIGPEQLKFTRDEILHIFSSKPGLTSMEVERLFKETEGWAAGLVLLRETQNPALKKLGKQQYLDTEQLFDYFATEVFDQASAELQQFLLCTAFLPFIPLAVAQALYVNEAEACLNKLCARNLFTYRVKGGSSIFQYHALFRNYLRAQALRQLPLEQKRALQKQSAQLLHSFGYTEHAVTTYIENELYSEAAQLILRLAPELCRQGRQQTLAQWVLALPNEIRLGDAWLMFWLGEASLALNDVQAKTYLESAYQEFLHRNDRYGQLFTAATVLEAMQWGDCTYRGVEVWSETVKRLYAEYSGQGYSAEQLRIHCGRLLADLLLGRVTTELAPIAERLQELVSQDDDPNRCIDAADILLGYYIMQSQRQKARVLIALVEPILADHSLIASKSITWATVFGYYLAFCEGNRQLAKQVWEEALEKTEQAQLIRRRELIRLFQAELALEENNLQTAACFLDTIEINHLQDLYGHRYQRLRARLALFENQPERAIILAQLALQYCEQIGLPKILQNSYKLDLILAYALSESPQDVERLIQQGVLPYQPSQRTICVLNACNALLAFQKKNIEQGKYLLLQALQQAQELNYQLLARLPLPLARKLSECALENDIEAKSVLDFVAQRKLLTPKPEWKNWPWAVKIYCLGKLEILITDQPLFAKGRTPIKVIELLQMILAFGGREVSIDRIEPLLWPGQGRHGDSGFKSALYRLRKILGEDAILVKDHHLSLNPEKVWVDAWALESELNRVQSGAKEATQQELEAVAPRILQAYRGHLAADVGVQLRSVVHAEALWGKVRRFLLRLAEFRTATKEYQRAAEIYRFAIQHDSLASEFYRGLIEVLIQMNRYAEALETYNLYARTVRTMLNRESTTELIEMAHLLGKSRAENGSAS